MEEHRNSIRRRTLKEGRVILTDSTVIDCRIRDLSESGARLEFGGLTNLPREFRLLIVSTNSIVPVAVAWQRGQLVGVYFTGAGQPAAARRI
jgi:hypothetical protein